MSRRAVAQSFPSFGRRRRARIADGISAQDEGSGLDGDGAAARGGSDQWSNDVRLFVITFAGGFLFMTIFLG